MAIRIVRLGMPRRRGEGVRLGTVRRPPRGVPKTRYSADDWFDVWLPNLAPSANLIARADFKNAAGWQKFARAYEAEMARPENSRLLDVLAALSHHANFAVGCYCENEQRCHRSVLARLLARQGAKVVSS